MAQARDSRGRFTSGSGNVTVRDMGWNRIRTTIRELDGAGVKVGIRARDAGRQGPDRVDVIDYAVYNEFGTEDIPSRPFMRRTADTGQTETLRVMRRWADMAMRGQMSVPQVLGSLGEYYQMRMQATIRSARRWAAPNAPSTIEAKGSSSPLIQHGILINSIGWEIDNGRARGAAMASGPPPGMAYAIVGPA